MEWGARTLCSPTGTFFVSLPRVCSQQYQSNTLHDTWGRPLAMTVGLEACTGVQMFRSAQMLEMSRDWPKVQKEDLVHSSSLFFFFLYHPSFSQLLSVIPCFRIPKSIICITSDHLYSFFTLSHSHFIHPLSHSYTHLHYHSFLTSTATDNVASMSTQVATVSTSMVSNVITLLRQRQKALVKRGKANPAMTMLALTAILYYWLGRMRAKKGPPRGKAVPHLKSKFFMLDVGVQYIKARAGGNELKWVQNLSKQGLTLTTEFIGHCLILVFEPSSVQHILVKNFENYPKGKLSTLLYRLLSSSHQQHPRHLVLLLEERPPLFCEPPIGKRRGEYRSGNTSPQYDGTPLHLIFILASPQSYHDAELSLQVTFLCSSLFAVAFSPQRPYFHGVMV